MDQYHDVNQTVSSASYTLHDSMCFHIYIAVTCEPLEPPQKGEITYDSTQSRVNGSVAIYACQNNTVMLGQSMRVCSINTNGTAKWTGEQPVCVSMSTISGRLI